MSLYCVNISGREYNVALKGNVGTVNGEDVKLDLLPLNGNGLHLLRQGGKALEIYLSSQNPDTYEVFVDGKRVIARVETLQSRLRRKKERANTGSVLAPMPGLVVSVAVQVGESVEQGQTLLVLESMKMQMQIRAQARGMVGKVGVQPGQQLEKGAFLIQIDPQS